MANPRLCSIPNCNKPVHGRGWCSLHYQRFRRNGDAAALKQAAPGDGFRYINETAIPFTGDECLFWPYGRATNGYAYCNIDGRKHIVSRWVCEYVNGPPPTPKHEAAHNCCNGHLGCINPKHLRWATHAENHQDRILDDSYGRKLSNHDVREIKRLYKKLSANNLAERYNVSREMIWMIGTGRSWANHQ